LVISAAPGVYTALGDEAEENVPLPPLHKPVEGVVITLSCAVELLQIVMGVNGVNVAGVETVTVA
jgi:hypothetical protein